jgi:hypothetical protein
MKRVKKQTFNLFTRLWFLLFLLSPVPYSWSQSTSSTSMKQWRVLPASYLEIKGKSNINSFGCSAKNAFKATPIEWIVQKDEKLKLKGSVTLAINALDCQNKMLNQDLRKTLKAQEYPTMTIHFLHLERMPILDGGIDFVSGKVQIDLAGTKKMIELRFSLRETSDGMILEGSQRFCFKDFNLTPPEKVGGLIKVRDQFDVAFALYLQ